MSEAEKPANKNTLRAESRSIWRATYVAVLQALGGMPNPNLSWELVRGRAVAEANAAVECFNKRWV